MLQFALCSAHAGRLDVRQFTRLFRATGAGKVTIEFEKTLPTQPDPELEKFTVTIK